MDEKKKKKRKSFTRPDKLKAIKKVKGARAASNKNRVSKRTRTKGGTR